MNLIVFNVALLIGWLMVLIGCCMLHLAAGLAASGLLLIVLTIYMLRLAGVYARKKTEGG